MNSIDQIRENFPSELLALPNWVVWMGNSGKKIPINPHNLKGASSTDPATWGTFDQAAALLEKRVQVYYGLGFCFPLDGSIVGVDVDNKDGPQVLDYYQNHGGYPTSDMVNALLFLDSYAEISPSGTGLHIFIKASIPPGFRNRFGKVEIYERGRFFTVTGNRLPNTLPELHDRQAELERFYQVFFPKAENVTAVEVKSESATVVLDASIASDILHRAAHDAKFQRLWAGDASDYDGDESRADFAICLKLAFYTGGNRAAIDSLFRQSGLMRDKWDKVHVKGQTYGQATIKNALLKWDGKCWKEPERPEPKQQEQEQDKNTGGGDGLADSKLPQQSVMAARLLKQLPYLAFNEVREDWMAYRDNHWQALDKRAAMRLINNALSKSVQVGYSSSYLNGLASFIEMNRSVSEWDIDRGLLPFRNGALRLADRQLVPHDPAHRLTWQIPYDYQLNGNPGPFVDWLLEAVGGHDDQLHLLRAYMNCILLGRPEYQKYLELIGPGGTGKGTFIRVCEMLVGNQNCHSTELKHLENNRFETAKLYGKRLVTITDSQNYAGDVSVLKAMTGQDSLRFEEKNKQAGNGFRFQGMLLIAANEPIASKDYTSGIARRRITVQFNHQVKSEQRRDLEAEFAPLIPSIVNWVLELPQEDVRDYMLQTDLCVPSLCDAARDNLLAVNPLAQWLDEKVFYQPGGEPVQIGGCWRQDGRIQNIGDWLYPNYVDFCESIGIRPLALNRFVNLLLELCRSQLGLQVERKVTKAGKHVVGLRLRRDGDDLGSPVDEKYPRKIS